MVSYSWLSLNGIEDHFNTYMIYHLWGCSGSGAYPVNNRGKNTPQQRAQCTCIYTLQLSCFMRQKEPGKPEETPDRHLKKHAPKRCTITETKELELRNLELGKGQCNAALR